MQGFFKGQLMYFLDLFGIAVFAITGSLVAGKKQMDFFGVIVIATVTGVGGGTIRDIILGQTPVFWIQNPTYLYVTVTFALATIIFARFFNSYHRWLVILDAFGLALFTIMGVEKTLSLGFSPEIAVIMGTVTGCCGGMVRDVLCGEIPLIMQKEIYATAALSGGIIFALVDGVGWGNLWFVMGSMLWIFFFRLAAIRWELSLPTFSLEE